MIDRRRFLCGLAAASIAPQAAAAQPAGKVWRIGYLSRAAPEFDRTWVAAFKQGLRELGYIEGRNVVIDQRHASGRSERLPDLASELVRSNADVIVVYGVPSAVHAVQSASATIPIVMAVAADPVGDKLVASLARPGGQVTGLSDAHADLVVKRLDLLKEVVPSASRIAVLLNPLLSSGARQLRQVQTAAPGLRMTLVPGAVKGPRLEDIDDVFATVAKYRPDALLIIPDPMFGAHQGRIAELAIRSRLPSIGTQSTWAEAGALMAYGTNFAELWRRAATYVDKILKGANPADLPVEQPTTFDLVVNLKTAKALGLTLPRQLLLRADHVIE